MQGKEKKNRIQIENGTKFNVLYTMENEYYYIKYKANGHEL